MAPRAAVVAQYRTLLRMAAHYYKEAHARDLVAAVRAEFRRPPAPGESVDERLARGGRAVELLRRTAPVDAWDWQTNRALLANVLMMDREVQAPLRRNDSAAKRENRAAAMVWWERLRSQADAIVPRPGARA